MKPFIFQKSRSWQLWLAMVILLVLLSACSADQPPTIPTSTDTPTHKSTITPTRSATPRPTATPTLPPLGETGNPVTMGFVLGQDNSASNAVEDLVDVLSQDTGYVMEALLYPDFESLSRDIANGSVHLFWLFPLEYLYLNEQGYADVELMTNHQGVFSYGIQFIANIHSGFTLFFNPETGETYGDILDALQQLSGTRPCFINPHSVSGYFIPLGLLANTSTPTLEPVFTYHYNAIIRALYIHGICDFGVTYALTGNPLTSSDILQNLPDAQNQIYTIWQSEGLIPNLSLSAAPNLPVFIRFRITEALLRMAEGTEGLGQISAALVYQVEALQSVEDHFYNPLRSALQPLELDLPTIIFESSPQ
ncbi:MAG: phosphate/phosphite/phosphonate ABC transporter substrate-binding protein [Chloroflexi bacterium]|jgi:ABC-type phosphate/phosphonate transport system substrate-binding protein|nr:phosphate/phosphite/phosphonate ABC transporter substrate-binding protein [Chloroflexota bacterium]